jgi:Domain of unknown function (DUF4304)
MWRLFEKLKGRRGLVNEIPQIPTVDVRSTLVEVLEPVLRSHGFEKFKKGRALRYREKWIDVIEIQFLRSYTIPTNSPSVHLGRYLSFVPEDAISGPVAIKNGKPVPETPLCHFRRTVYRTSVQKGNRELNMWAIGGDDNNLAACAVDVLHATHAVILPWFEMLGDMSQMFSLIQSGEADVEGKDKNPVRRGTWNFVNYFSRQVVTGLIAFELGDWKLAMSLLEKVLAAGGVVGKNGKVFPLPDASIKKISDVFQVASERSASET